MTPTIFFNNIHIGGKYFTWEFVFKLYGLITE